MPNGPLCVALMPPRSHTTKGLNENWCRQQELSPAFAAVVCAFPLEIQNSVSCCAERTIRKKATATIASLVLPRRLYWLTPFWMPCGRRNRSIVSTGIGSVTRDLAIDKRFPDQDIMELRDELMIARTVYDHRHCGYESNRPISDMEEEGMKRVNAIESNREEARERQLSVFCERAKHEVEKMAKELERRDGATLDELERTLEAKKRESSALQADREDRICEYEHTVERIRTRKQTEESASVRLRQAMQQLEQGLSLRQSTIETKEQQLEMVQIDRAKGREAVMRERHSIEAVRRTVREERCRQRRQLIHQIKEMNTKFLEQVRPLAEERKKKREQAKAKEDVAERALAADIKMIEEYLPKLISVEDIPVNPG
ncbi:hypothetical protein C3747_273g34 [Trypanosoma cruzi]|uniref:Uncharacterized protein n=1 Tax=Trypanosoma cruzi TaxID=5693 RepID=A0A2V2VEM6_TRYCR|nr:hypothetical protein C3747_273g34 [Trypanosoma cruzi]RNC41774.1 subtilisin-like serine peptidase [Trypanosoma cruzi]